MSTITLTNVIDDFARLSLDDKEYALDILKKQCIEAKRDYLANRAKEAADNLNSGQVKKGGLKELYEDLES